VNIASADVGEQLVGGDGVPDAVGADNDLVAGQEVDLGGTLFLDELDGAPAATQSRLLRALEERAVRPVGGDVAKSVDVRVVAACHGPLERKVSEGRFRADLYYRLAVLTLALPPLRSRREDLPALIGELLRRRGLDARNVTGDNLDALTAHSWPGNVRELRNVIDRAIALSPGASSFAELRIGLVATAAADSAVPIRGDLQFAEAKAAVLHDFERRYLREAFHKSAGNVSATARAHRPGPQARPHSAPQARPPRRRRRGVAVLCDCAYISLFKNPIYRRCN
jgi:transcriptional regulator with PAS, ATPase and Fis domain